MPDEPDFNEMPAWEPSWSDEYANTEIEPGPFDPVVHTEE